MFTPQWMGGLKCAILGPPVSGLSNGAQNRPNDTLNQTGLKQMLCFCHMPPVPEQQNPVPPPVPTLRTPPSTFIKSVRILLLVLIVIGLGLIATEKLWVPKLVNLILNQALLAPVATTQPVPPAWKPLEATSTDFAYNIQNGAIVFKGRVDQSNTIPSPSGDISVNTDLNSFVVSSINTFFAKDSTHVFYTGVILPMADPQSFEVLQGGYDAYAKDKNYVYYEVDSSNASDSLTPIPNADSATFISLENPYAAYAKDKNYVYYNGRVISGADPQTFQILNVNTDPNSCYGGYTKDKNHIYYCASIVPEADSATFSLLLDSANATSSYAKDANHVFYAFSHTVITGADPVSFVVLADGYAKDKNHIYGVNYNSSDTPLDLNTFAIVQGTHFGEYVRDSQRIFYKSESDGFGGFLNNVSADSFVALNDVYGKDTQHVYYGNQVVPKADTATFHVFTPQKEWVSDGNMVWNSQWYYAADKNSVYFAGKVLRGTDVATFHLDTPSGNFCNQDCASDKNHTYDMSGSISN